jgi:WD40 repeat protein
MRRLLQRFRLLALLLFGALAMAAADARPAFAQQSTCVSGAPAVTFTGGGRHLLVYSSRTTRVWDSRSREVFVLHGDTWRAVSPDGLTLATQRPDNTIRLWSIDGRRLAVLTGHRLPIEMVRFSPDGAQVITGSTGELVRLWDAEGRPIASLPLESGAPLVAEFSPDSRRLLVATAGGGMLIDRSGRLMTTFDAAPNSIEAASFSPDGELIITAGLGGARLWDSFGQPLAAFDAEGEHMIAASFSPDGVHVVTRSAEETSRVWDLDGRLLGSFLGEARFTPDGDQLLTIAPGGDIRLRDLNGWTITAFDEAEAAIVDAAISPDGRRLLTLNSRGAIEIWDNTGARIASGARVIFGWSCLEARAAFSPDGTRAATLGFGQAPQLWDLVTVSRAPLPMTTRPWWIPEWLSPAALLGFVGLWLAATRMHAPIDARRHTPLTILKIWPAWVAIAALALPPLVLFAPFLTPLGGALLARLLWPVVRGFVPKLRMRRWIVAGTLGWVAGWALAEGVRLLLFPHGVYIDTRQIVIPAAGIGMTIGQWVALRGHLRGAHWLIAAALVAWPAGAALTAAEYSSGGVLLTLLQGLITGAISASVVVWLLMEPD